MESQYISGIDALKRLSMKKIVLFWFRRDLRLKDNAGLYHALKSGYKVLPIFIFDKTILEKLPTKNDKRVDFIHQTITQINKQLQQYHSGLLVSHNTPLKAFEQIISSYDIEVVYANHDYEPYARERDENIKQFLASKGIDFITYKDQCIFEKSEVTKDDGKPYTVFTPYSKKWKAKLSSFYVKSYQTENYFSEFYKTEPKDILTLNDIGFKKTNLSIPSKTIRKELLVKYSQQRDFPFIQGTTMLSIHLRFGTVSIRELTRSAISYSETWLNELIWRDFYMMILFHFPYVVKGAFKPAYNNIVWRNNEQEFKAWCDGKTGYPIVDAGMRQLNATGFMHNRVRMIVASFLVKDLLIDWRWGEAYFAEKLLDFDLSANNGGWQWAAGSGCDAAPYFRIFNPTEQTKKFDKELQYINTWIPELNSPEYPAPIVEHAQARIRTLKAYKDALSPPY